MKFILYVNLFLVFYTYLGYPLILFVLSKIKFKPVTKKKLKLFPYVSIIISAKNEEKNIAARLQNLISQAYDGRLEIIVVSDGSVDGTPEIIKKNIPLATKKGIGLELIECHSTRGKPHALNKAVKRAKGDIIVFTDSRQKFKTDTISELVKNFAVPEIGCVSGELIFLESDDSEIEAEMNMYWKYEKMIRKLESKTGSVVGATGAVYAIRTHLYEPVPHHTLLDDVLIPLNIASKGFRVIFDQNAIAYDVVSKTIENEWQRKVRTLAGNWQLFSIAGHVMNPFQNKIWWRFFSHKIFRLFVPLFLVIILLDCFVIGGPYLYLAYLQLIFYGISLITFKIPYLKNFSVLRLGCFFCTLNLAVVVGFVYWVKGQAFATWKKD